VTPVFSDWNDKSLLTTEYTEHTENAILFFLQCIQCVPVRPGIKHRQSIRLKGTENANCSFGI
jgi:hypothetical protein